MRLRPIINKRGQITGILYFFMALFLILFIGFLISIGTALVDFVADETIPELSNLGGDEDTNLTEYGDLTLTPVNTFIQALPGIVGTLYLIMLIGVLGLAYAFRATGERWLLFLFFGLTITLVLASITISIIYEDFYDDSGALGDRLQEQDLLSFLILYSPMLMTVIAFIGAMIMFTGFEEAQPI